MLWKTCFQEKVFSETRLYLGIFEKVCPIRSDEGAPYVLIVIS